MDSAPDLVHIVPWLCPVDRNDDAAIIGVLEGFPQYRGLKKAISWLRPSFGPDPSPVTQLQILVAGDCWI